MADRLQGISFTEADFISMLKDFVSEGDVTKKINVDVKGADQGAKDISKVSDALTKLNSIKTDDVTNQLTTISTLLTKRFQSVNLNQFTSKLISAFQDPAKSAADLADIIHDVYTDLTTLASVTNAKSFGGFSESDIRKTIAKQKKVLDLKKQLDVEQTTARTDANAKQKPVDILTKAKTYKIQRKSAIDVGDSLGIDRSTVNVQNNDDTLLQTYQRTADVLSKMISERKEYNKLNKTNVSDYLQQEQDILSVFRQLQNIESQVSEKFQISSENLLSNQFKNNNGQFDFVENARKAVNAYVTQMTSSTQKAFQNAQDDLGKHLATAAKKSVSRLSDQNEVIGRTSQKLRNSKSAASSTAAAQAGTEIGESVATGMEKAKSATESATSGIEKYLLSAEQTIGKLKELRQTLEDLDTEYLDSDMSDEKIEKKIQDTSTESLRYIANLRRLGYSKQDIDQILGKTLDDENWTSYIDTYAKESNANKDIIKRISTYKDQSIAETPTSLNPTSIEETRSAIEETKSSIEVLLEYLNQLKTQDLGNLSTGFDQLPPKIREAINELGLLNKETDKLNFADTGHTNHGVIVGEQHTLISKNANSEKYAQALQLKDALDQAADAGANVARILDIAFDSSTNTMLQLQQTASGDLISNIPGYGESSDNLKFNETLLEATDEQIIKLINDLETLNSLGINVDFTDSNFLYDKQKGFSIIDLAMKDQGASDYGASDLLEMFGFIRDEFSYAGKDTSAVDSFIERIKTAVTLREELQKPGGNTGLLDTTDAEGKINSLKDELASLREELQRFKDIGVEPEGITELQTKLQDTERRAESLSSELTLLQEHSVDTATYGQLEEELEQAKASAESLREELSQVRTELEQSKPQDDFDSNVLDKKITELTYLYDKVRTIFDGKDGIVNEDMTYSEKFDSTEVQRMIELLSQLSDAELRAAGVMPDDDDSYNTFRYNLQAEVNAIKEAQEMLQQAYDTGNYNGFDASEIDVSIWDRLEHIYEMAQEVTSQFNSNLTPAVREFLSLIQDQVGADNMADFWGSQNVDSYINDIINGTKTAKEAFADLENSFGWDTNRFTSLIDGDIPQELQGLYEQLFSDVENRIKSAEQAAEEFNAKLKEMHDTRSEQQMQQSIDSHDQQQVQSAESAEEHLSEATAAAAQAGANVSEVASQHQEQAQAAEEAAASEEHLKEATESTAQAGSSIGETAVQHEEQTKAAEEAAIAEEHLKEVTQEAANTDIGEKTADVHKQQEKAAADAADSIKSSTKEQDSAVQSTKAAVDELIKSYERLADAEAKATNGSTAVVREKGRTKAEEIKTRQAELETKISGKTTAKQDAQINAAKDYYERLRTAYENDRVRTSKDLGFESGNNVDKTWDTLIDKAQQYENILNKQNNLHKSLTVNESSFLAKYADMYKEAGEKAEEAGEKGKKFNEAIEEAQSLIRSNTIDDFSQKIGDLTAEGDNMPQAYNDQVRELRENLAKLKEIDFDTTKGGNWGQLVDSINNGLNKLNTDPFMQKVNELQKETLNRQMSDWANNHSGAGEYLDQVKALQQALQSAASQGDVDRIAAGFEKIKSSAAEAGKTGESFGEGLMKRFKSLGQYLLSFASFYKVVDVFKQAVGVVKELDTALVELKKVSDESTQSYSNFMKNSFDMADEVGTTAQSIINSTADWKRLGESFEEAQKSATTSTVLLNVSEFSNIEDATQSLVSASQAYKDLDKMDIVDKLNNIGNNFSVSTDELATGLKNAAAVLATQGNDIDQALALLTAGNTVTQDISKTSAGIRTISLRIAGKMLPERMVTYGYVNTY